MSTSRDSRRPKTDERKNSDKTANANETSTSCNTQRYKNHLGERLKRNDYLTGWRRRNHCRYRDQNTRHVREHRARKRASVLLRRFRGHNGDGNAE